MSNHSSKVQFLKNVGTGWLAVFVTGLVGFLSLPLNLKHLGTELYGISLLVVSTLTLFSFLQMGMQPALLRFFSHAAAEKDHETFRSLSGMAQLLLGGLGFVGAVGFLCVFPWFVSIYENEIPEAVHRDLFVLFLAVAFDFWSTLFLIPFTTAVQAGNRFDMANLQQCLAKVLRITVLFIGYSFFTPSLLILAASTFAGTLYQLTSLIFLAWKIHGNTVFFQRKSLRWNLLPPLFSFSVWNLVNLVFFELSIQVPLLIIGKTLGVGMVAAFYPAIVLSGLCASILTQVSTPLVPMASRDVVENGGKNLGRWAIQMGEITACMGCSMIVVFALFGREIITLWLGESLAWTGTIVTITAVGTVFAAVQTPGLRLVLGGKFSYAPIALSSVVMAVLAALGTFLGTYFGGWSLLETAAWIVFTRLLRNTFYLSFLFSRLLRYRFAEYIWRVNIKPLLLSVILIGVFYGLKWRFAFSLSSDSRLMFFFLLAFFSLLTAGIHLSLCWRFILRKNMKKNLLQLVKGKADGSW